MLAHGIYVEHVLSVILGLFGFIAGAAAIVAVLRGKRSVGLAFAAVLASMAVVECGIFYFSGSVVGWDHLDAVLESPDFRWLFLPGLLIGVVGLLAGAFRTDRSPA